MERTLNTIGILTSGGDAPGMNAAIRAVTRSARFNNMNVIGVMRGYQGLIDHEFVKFTSSSVSNTIQRGGTILKTARSSDFLQPEGRKKAVELARSWREKYPRRSAMLDELLKAKL